VLLLIKSLTHGYLHVKVKLLSASEDGVTFVARELAGPGVFFVVWSQIGLVGEESAAFTAGQFAFTAGVGCQVGDEGRLLGESSLAVTALIVGLRLNHLCHNKVEMCYCNLLLMMNDCIRTLWISFMWMTNALLLEKAWLQIVQQFLVCPSTWRLKKWALVNTWLQVGQTSDIPSSSPLGVSWWWVIVSESTLSSSCWSLSIVDLSSETTWIFSDSVARFTKAVSTSWTFIKDRIQTGFSLMNWWPFYECTKNTFSIYLCLKPADILHLLDHHLFFHGYFVL